MADDSPVSRESWGDYATVAGKTTRPSESTYQLRWRWEKPGHELIEEYWQPDGSRIAHMMAITLGAERGTLVLQSSALGNKVWNGTVQPDGTVLFIGKGLLKLPYLAGLSDDGAWEVRRVKLDGARIASVKPADEYNHFILEGDVEDAVAVASATGTQAPDEPGTGKAETDDVQGAADPLAPQPAVATVAAAEPASESRAPAPEPVAAAPGAPKQGPRQLSEADLALLRSRMDTDKVRRMQNLRREQQAAEAQRRKIAWQMEQDRLDAAQEEAEYEAEQAESAANWGNVLNAFERGFNQVNADNLRMRDTLQSGIDRGIAQGAALYAQKQAEQARLDAQARAADAAYARDVREREELARQARVAEQRAAEAQRAAQAQRMAELRSANLRAAEREAPDPVAAGSAGRASTLTDPNTCVTPPRTSPNRACGKGFAATISNQCAQPVDARVCHMTVRGWDCGASWGIQPGSDWSYAVCASTGETFMSVRSTGTDQPLASPPGG
ncbi:hypothetical protein [Lysobacter sp. D1-1-M9]|uniref:hypothetical protein n=1 Tax=Novilysobacter longmucuonensis TaxID=3098603 RepID=UPI002FC710A1